MFEAVMQRCAGLRRPGAAALDLCYVAAGYYDGFFETGLKPWDVAAGSLMVTEAGGLVGNFTGEADFLDQREVVAGSPKIYGQLVQMLTPYTRAARATTPSPRRSRARSTSPIDRRERLSRVEGTPSPYDLEREIHAGAGSRIRPGRICRSTVDLGHRSDPAEHHLLAAEAWLCRAHDANRDGGVSYGYSIRGGWRPSYPETSGYIATTFFRLARDRDPAYFERALRIIAWLLAIQNSDGSFANPRYGREGIVFDTGQVLFALVRGYELTGDPAMLGARAPPRAG